VSTTAEPNLDAAINCRTQRANDDQPVDLVFLLLLPSAPHEPQLNALACVARALRDADTLH
jgi:mannitol/fructose-specific phosphotransferase system IIA component (Ntr-type)